MSFKDDQFSSHEGKQVQVSNQIKENKDKLIVLPIPIWMIVNLKKGYGGRTIEATMKPMIEPDMELRTTFIGINHLQNHKTSPNWHLYITWV